jgi:hypothetical protein
MGQTSTLLAPLPGVPGKAYDYAAIQRGDIVSATAGVPIPFGVLCELSSTGVAQPVKDTNANWPPNGLVSGTSMLGISMWGPENWMEDFLGNAPSVPPAGGGSSTAGYAKGARVPFMRVGRIWVAWDGTTPLARIGNVNVWHSSDGSHAQGVFTMTATATTAGAEISAAPSSMEVWNPDNTQFFNGTDQFGNTVQTFVLGINLPGSGS